MLPVPGGMFGNPSSAPRVRAGRARGARRRARAARPGIGAEAREIVFTSGGTEANNLALKGAAWAGKCARPPDRHDARSSTTPSAHALALPREVRVRGRRVPVDRYGRVDPTASTPRSTSATILVSVMLANNEVGTLQPIADDRGGRPRHRGVLLPRRRRAGRAARRPRRRRPGRRPRRARARTRPRGPKGVGALWIRHGHAHPRPAARRVAGAPPARRDGERRGCRRHGACVRAAVAGAPSDGRARPRPPRPARGRPRRRGHRADGPPARPPARTSCRSSPAASTAPRRRWRSTSRGSRRPTGSACTTGSTDASATC